MSNLNGKLDLDLITEVEESIGRLQAHLLAVESETGHENLEISDAIGRIHDFYGTLGNLEGLVYAEQDSDSP